MYRASPHGLAELIETVPAEARAMLALYCYRRGHLQGIGLTIAVTCDENDLNIAGGNAGAALFARSRETVQAPRIETSSTGRRKVTLASGRSEPWLA